MAGRTAPVVLAGERVLPVQEALAPLLAEGGLRRGSVLMVGAGPGFAGAGATSLALALLAGPSAAGSWCAVVGEVPSLGVAAAAEVGVALERFPLVAVPAAARPGVWASVVATLLDAFDVVLAWPPPHLRAAEARRLVARTRERSSVLVLGAGPGRWPERCEVSLMVAGSEWVGLGRGHGMLAGRRLEVVATGPRAAARERRVRLWLPPPPSRSPQASEEVFRQGGAEPLGSAVAR